ncbi:MAG: hypothetical protein HC880_09060 [Bacteroidia bacterium]|nr:hypothetical protein [Bacteroidia bacterium]
MRSLLMLPLKWNFIITENLPNTLASGTSATFSLSFKPSALGNRSAMISIAHNDADKNPFTFKLYGEGTQKLTQTISIVK